MKISRWIGSSLVPSLLAAAIVSAAVACSSGITFEPIVIDVSKPTPTPVPPTPVAGGVGEPPPPTATQAAAPPAPTAIAAAVPSAASPAPGAVDSPGAVVAKLRSALDRGDLEAALALWAPDATIELEGGRPGGRDAIRRWLAEQIAAGTAGVTRKRVESGASVAETLAESGGLALYEVRAGRIVRLRISR